MSDSVQVLIAPDGQLVQLVMETDSGRFVAPLDPATARQIASWLVQGAEHVERTGAVR